MLFIQILNLGYNNFQNVYSPKDTFLSKTEKVKNLNKFIIKGKNRD